MVCQWSKPLENVAEIYWKPVDNFREDFVTMKKNGD
jgi:hypothetical protein